MSDGCTSTNDTVILLASGLAGPVDEAELARAVEEACFSLAAQMVGDAEGATKVVRVEVVGAASDDDADRGARAIARSQLTKCSWFGEDPYWGRIGSDLGSAGIAFDPTAFSIAYGGTVVAAEGVDRRPRRGRGGRAHGRAPPARSPPTSASATARPSC